jgi:Spy/CpxP family protein refolding chaperone
MKTSNIRTPSVRLLVATAVLALAGGLVQTASAMPYGGGPGHHGGYGGGPGMGMMHGAGPGAGMMGGRGMGPMGGMLDSVNASAEQKAQIQQIWQAARTDVSTLREAGRALREQQRALFAQPTVDAAAAEALRQQMLAQHDQVSKRMLQAQLDASRVLTAEQRKQLSEQMAQRQALRERHRAEREALGGGPRRP